MFCRQSYVAGILEKVGDFATFDGGLGTPSLALQTDGSLHLRRAEDSPPNQRDPRGYG